MLVSLEELNRDLIHLFPSGNVPAVVEVLDLPRPEMMVKIIIRRRGEGMVKGRRRGRGGKG